MAAGPLRPEHPRSRQTQLLRVVLLRVVLPLGPCIQLCTASVSGYPLGLLRTPSRHEDARAREAAAASCDPVARSKLPSCSPSPVVSLLSLHCAPSEPCHSWPLTRLNSILFVVSRRWRSRRSLWSPASCSASTPAGRAGHPTRRHRQARRPLARDCRLRPARHIQATRRRREARGLRSAGPLKEEVIVVGNG
jgi:hypothetical protein